MANSTWTWIGGTAAATIAADWTLTAGSGNAQGFPQAGDTAINRGGNVLLLTDPHLVSNTVELGGTAGVAALSGTGTSGTNFTNPTFDANTLLTSAVPGNTTPETSVLNAAGIFVNQGTILADGPAGSTFTLNVQENTVGTVVNPGYFYNPGTIQADAGNTLIVNVGSASELFNSGEIIADGGTVKITVAAGAIAGGDAAVRGFDIIEGGGTLETASSFPASDGNNGSRGNYEFGDNTPGNTLKIDNIGSFGGVILGFSAGNTIDVGTLLAVGTLAYNGATGFLSLEAANGATLATLLVGNGGTGFADGTFALVGGSADGITVGVGADGDTVLTTSLARLEASNISGTWQSAGSWVGGTIPAATAYPGIGLNATTPFTLTTGNTAVSVGGFGIDSAAATVQITSNVTLTQEGNTGQISDYAGTLDIATGSTVIGGAIQLYQPSASVTIAAGATAELAGRLNFDLAPSGGVWNLQPGSNPAAFSVAAGTAVVDGTVLAGPTPSTRGGSTGIAYESGGQSAVVIVNAGGTVTDTHNTMGSDPTSSGTLVLNGAGASWTDMIDTADTAYSRGNITVGYDDVALNTPGTLAAPTPIAAAQVLIENGATLTDQGTGGSIAGTEDSAGTVTVTTGGVWNLGYDGTSGGIGIGFGNNASGSLLVLNGGTVAIAQNGTYLSNGTTSVFGGIGVGQSAGATGTIIVSGAGSKLTNAAGMSIGKAGQGLLGILNGGTVTETGYGGGISDGTALVPSSSGTIIVGGSGAAAALNFAAASGSVTAAGGLTIGSASKGTLIVADNGTVNLNGTGYLTVGSAVGSVGSVIVGGTAAAAVINIGTEGLTVGNSGTGYLAVNSIGTVALNGTGYLTVGSNFGGSGSVVVGGGSAGALINIGGQAGLTVGNNGTGTLAVQDHGTVDVNGTGYLTIGSNGGSVGSIVVGGTAASAVINVGTAGITVGNNGTGYVTVNSLGTIDVTGNNGTSIIIGDNSGAVGTVTVNGGLLAEGPAATGLTVGQNSGAIGLLSITNHGTVSLAGGGMVLGSNFAAAGTVTVQGTGSELITTGTAGIIVGQNGNGTLTVSAGGAVNDANGLAVGGNGGGSNSFVSVSGGTLTAADFTVGEFGNGTLTVTNGGKVFLNTSTASSIAEFGGGNGTVTVNGAGSLLQGQSLVVGESGQGTLAVQNGGSVSLASLTLGNGSFFGTTGIVSVTGGGEVEAGALSISQGSTLSVDGSSGIDIGTSGSYVTGAINIESGHTLTGVGLVSPTVVNDGAIDAGGGGTLEIAGSISGTGSIYLSPSSEIQLDQAFPSNETIAFAPTGGGVVVFNAPSSVIGNAITGLNIGDKIEFGGITNISNVSVTSPGTISVQTNAGTYLLTDVSFASGAPEQFNWFNDFSTGDWTIQVAPLNVTWTGAVSTDLGTAGNWSPNSVPSSNETINFNSGGGTLTGTGTGLNANFNFGSWVLQAATLSLAGSPNPPYQPFAFQDQSAVVVNGGALTGAGTANIGSSTGATMTVEGGAQVSFQGTMLGNGPGNSGTLLVTGAGTTLRNVYSSSPAGDGGYLTIGNSPSSPGMAPGVGQVTITNGAAVIDSSSDSLALSTGSQGILTVSAGGSLQDAGLDIGSSGSGTVTVNGGTITAGNFGITVGGSGTGVMTVTNGTVTAAGIGVASNFGGSGTLSIQTGGTVTDTGNGTSIGFSGDGTLAVNGGRLTSLGYSQLGNSPGAVGVATVSNGGIWTNAQGLAIGENGSGTVTVAGGTVTADGISAGSNPGGNGTLSIQAGGTVTDVGTYTFAGNSNGSAGTITVSGAGAVLNSNAFIIGNFGTGFATVSNGGVVNSGSLAVGQFADGSLTVQSGGLVTATGTVGAVVGNTSGSDGQLAILAGGTVALSSSALTIGASNGGGSFAAAQGTVTVSGANALLSSTVGITVGNSGTGDLQVLNGGSVAITGAGGGITIAQGGGFGSLLVSGAGAMVNLGTAASGIAIGSSGSGTLDVESGGTVLLNGTRGIGIGSSAGGTGLLLVNGPNALVEQGIGTTGMGVGQAGSGTVEVENGGSIILDETGASFGMSVGQTAGAHGLVIVSGSNALLEMNTPNAGLTVGQVSQGTLEVLAGGTVLLNVGSGMTIGGTLGASGTVSISGAGSSLTTTGTVSGTGITVGSSGAGTLNITAGGALNDGHGLVVGGAATGTGSVLVSAGTLTTGYVNVGSGGSGTVTVTSGGQVLISGLESSDVGASAGGSGSLVINGGTVVDSAAYFGVGSANANGTLLVEGGGTLITGSGTAFADINATGTGHATATVSGGVWLSGGSLIVGDTGTGSLTINSGGLVNAGANLVAVGNQAGGSGMLSIASSGTLIAGEVIAGASNGGLGTIAVNGTGSVLDAGSVVVGVGGTGTLAVIAGAIVSATGSVTVGAHGVLDMQGGTIDPTAVLLAAGSGANGGTGVIDATLEIDNASTLYALAGTLTLNAPIVHAGSLGGTGALAIGSGGDLAINGAVDASQVVNFDGTGTLTIGDIRQFAPADITGFAAGDAIVVDGVGSLTQSFNSATDQLVLTDQIGNNYTLQFTGSLTAAEFTTAVVPGSLSATGAWSTDLSGDFDDPTKWVGGVVPGASADAVIDFTNQPQVVHDSGSDTVDSVRNIAGDFIMSGGTLTANTLENDSSMSWTGGSLVLNSGTGGTATLLNTAGATLTIAANGQRLSTAGTASVGNTGTVLLAGASGLATTGTVTTGTASVTNAGTIVVSGGSGTANIDAPLTNTGSVIVNQGTLSLNGGGSSNGAGLQGGAGGVLQFGLPASGIANTFSITGGEYAVGNTTIDGGTLDVSAASAVFFVDSLRLAGAGTLLLGAQNATAQDGFVQGPSSWAGATGIPFLSGTGALTVYGGGTLVDGVESGSGLTRLIGTNQLGGSIQLDGGRTVENDGWMTWSSGNIALGAGDAAAANQSGTITNVAGATFYITADGRIGNQGAGTGVLNNAGVTAVFAGVGETDIDATVNNTGFIQAQSGTLSLNGGGSSAGANLFVAYNAVVQFGTMAGGAPGGTFSITSGQYTAGDTVITGGTLDVSAASGAVFVNQLEITAGALLLGSLSNGVDQGALEQSGGLLKGSGLFTVYAGASLLGGVQSGAATTRLYGTSVLGGTFALDGGRTLENDGWMNWSAGNIALGSGDASAVTQSGTLTNVAGATVYVTADGRIATSGAGSGVVNNAGVIAVFAGAGETDIDAFINDTGGLQAQSGVLGLNGGGMANAGDLFVASNAVVQFGTTAATGTGGTFVFNGGPYIGSTVVNGSTVDLSAVSGVSFGASLTVSGGALLLGGDFPSAQSFVQSGGEVSGTGIFTVAAAAQLSGGLETGSGRTDLQGGGSISGAVQLDGGRSLENDGVLTWTGGSITLGGGDPGAATQAATLINTAVFEIETNGTINSAGFPGTGTISNTGTIEKSGGLGTTSLYANLFNNGVVDVTAGTLALEQGVGGTGTFLLDGAATLDFVNDAGSSNTMQFLHPGGTLEVASTGQFGPTISGFATGDTIDAAAVGFVTGTMTVGFSGGTLTVTEGVNSAGFALSGSYQVANFQLASDGHGGTAVTYV